MKTTSVVGLGIVAIAGLALALTPTRRDEIHWRWSSYQGETASYESYLKSWPEGRHAVEARKQYDQHGWADAQAANTIQSYRAYAAAHLQGKFVQQAESKASALRTEQAPYDTALRVGTEDALRKFLTDYPGHEKEDEAQQTFKDIVEGRDIVDLLDEKKIEVETQGSGIKSVRVRIRKLVPYPITVRVPVGSYFVSARRSAQNMVTTGESTVRLTTDDWRSVSVSAACANRPRNIPSSGDSFTVQRSPQQAELARLVPVLDKAGVPYAVRQAAVWIVTDNADYGDLGVLVSRSPSQMSGGPARSTSTKLHVR